MSEKKKQERTKVRWIKPALLHKIDDETEELTSWVNRVGLKAELVELVDGKTKTRPAPKG